MHDLTDPFRVPRVAVQCQERLETETAVRAQQNMEREKKRRDDAEKEERRKMFYEKRAQRRRQKEVRSDIMMLHIDGTAKLIPPLSKPCPLCPSHGCGCLRLLHFFTHINW